MSFIGQGFFLGLATGHICVVSCGPIYAPYLMQKNRSTRDSIVALLQMSVGRFGMYVLVGALAGYWGQHIEYVNRTWFTSIAYILLSAFLVLSAFRTHKCETGCQLKKWHRFTEWPLVLGLVTGINFCPAFLIALTKATDLSGPMAGILLFAAFFVGTNIFLVPFCFFGILGRQKLLRTVARIASFAVAIWFVGNAAHSIYGLVRSGQGILAGNHSVISIMDETPLYVVNTDTSAREIIANAFAAKRPGPVYCVSSVDKLPKECYVLLGPEHIDHDRKFGVGTKAPGRFVIVLPFSPADEPYRASIQRTVKFLGKFHFKTNRDSGSVYFVPKNLAVCTQNP